MPIKLLARNAAPVSFPWDAESLAFSTASTTYATRQTCRGCYKFYCQCIGGSALPLKTHVNYLAARLSGPSAGMEKGATAGQRPVAKATKSNQMQTCTLLWLAPWGKRALMGSLAPNRLVGRPLTQYMNSNSRPASGRSLSHSPMAATQQAGSINAHTQLCGRSYTLSRGAPDRINKGWAPALGVHHHTWTHQGTNQAHEHSPAVVFSC